MKVFRLISLLFILAIAYPARAQKPGVYNAIYSGTPWFDDRGNVVSAHGGGIIKDNGRYYFFGEKHTDTSNAFAGFNCYSSTDLYNWKFESIALPVQDTGKLGPNRVGERVKVMKCPKTGEYVMYMHADDMGYKDQYVSYATSKTVTGPYTFKGMLPFNGKPIRKWDMGTFQDNDGSGYVLVHSGEIYRLSDDYKSVTEQVIKDMSPECESPAIFKKGGVYFWVASHRTSWERNDNFYLTATSLKGPWTARGIFAPAGTLTWNSQTTFVLPIAGARDTTFMFMGDRWSYPLQASAASYVWQPFTVSGTTIFIPKFMDAWRVNTTTGAVSAVAISNQTTEPKKTITYKGQWQHTGTGDTAINNTDASGAAVSVKFIGKQVGFYSATGPNGGYAKVTIQNSAGKTMLSSVVDMYSNYPVTALRFISPEMTKGSYILTLTPLGEHSKWSDKRKADYGSKGNVVSLAKVVVTP